MMNGWLEDSVSLIFAGHSIKYAYRVVVAVERYESEPHG